MAYTFKGIDFPNQETAMAWEENNRKVAEANRLFHEALKSGEINWEEVCRKEAERRKNKVDALKVELSAILQKAKTLDSKDIPDSKKNITINELEISIRMNNLLTNMGLTTIWELVHIDENEMWKRNHGFRTWPRFAELIDALKKAIALLTDTTNPEASKQVSDTP